MNHSDSGKMIFAKTTIHVAKRTSETDDFFAFSHIIPWCLFAITRQRRGFHTRGLKEPYFQNDRIFNPRTNFRFQNFHISKACAVDIISISCLIKMGHTLPQKQLWLSSSWERGWHRWCACLSFEKKLFWRAHLATESFLILSKLGLRAATERDKVL